MRTLVVGKALGASIAAWLGAVTLAQAGIYQGTPNPVSPTPGTLIPTPLQVTGKEYLDMPNKDALNVLSPQQVIAWDGRLPLGGVTNSLNYSPTTPYTSVNADALANHGDALFQAVINNQAALLVSVTADWPGVTIKSESVAGNRAPWAATLQTDQHGVTDLDGLEVWGSDWQDDSDRFSLLGDPGGTAVWAYGPGGSSSLITDALIGNAIGLASEYWSSLDLDGLMMWDNGDDYFAPGEMALISIRPIDGFDGGEVWVLNGNGTAAFLNHGGHVWDTAFDVKTAFDSTFENIDALEAVAIPEPGTLGLLTLGGLALLWRKRS